MIIRKGIRNSVTRNSDFQSNDAKWKSNQFKSFYNKYVEDKKEII